jgi:hypothetical protein
MGSFLGISPSSEFLGLRSEVLRTYGPSEQDNDLATTDEQKHTALALSGGSPSTSQFRELACRL